MKQYEEHTPFKLKKSADKFGRMSTLAINTILNNCINY